ncbi:MAG: ribosome maturation factor RimM [Acidaminococcaceae bacterium]|nr:ribosome maturation factor RimM [Acidaminococcaceae bacterium]
MQNEIIIGKIVAPHGVRGDIRILPMTENPELFLDLEYLLVGNGQRLTVKRARFQKNMVLVSTEEITDMDAAEKLRNKNVLINRADLPPLPNGRFYVSDLAGCVCVDEQGTEIGVFKDTMPTGSVDVFVIVDKSGKEILVPAVKDNILQIDVKAKRMLVRLPKWDDEK